MNPEPLTQIDYLRIYRQTVANMTQTQIDAVAWALGCPVIGQWAWTKDGLVNFYDMEVLKRD